MKLADFGLAKQDVTLSDGATTYCGTPEYLSPEMIKIRGTHSGEYGFEIDYWAVGNLMYEMFACRPPFQDKNPKVMIENILTQKVRFPEKKVATVPFRDIVQGFLERDPKHRLGCGEKGVDEIKTHPFFASINWVKLLNREIEPPIRPDLKNSLTRNFDKCFTDLDPNISIASQSDLDQTDAQQTAKAQSGGMIKFIGGVLSRALNPNSTENMTDEELLDKYFKDFAFTSDVADDDANGKGKGGNLRDSATIRESEFDALWDMNDEDMNAT